MSEIREKKSKFYSYMHYEAGARELSESRYNLTIGATLTWGFLLNFLLMQFAVPPILRFMLTSYDRYVPFMMFLLIGYIVLVLVGGRLVRSYNPGTCFLGYNLIAVPVGLLASLATVGYDPGLVIRAVLITAIVTLTMMIVSSVFPAVFQRMMPALGVSLLAVVIVELLAMLLFRMDVTIFDWIIVGIMSLYVGYDWVRANSVQRTTANAIAAASALYLDIINIFLRILRILARSSRD